MTAPLPRAALELRAADLPRIIFVLGKGGVGRSTVSTALGLALARGGERVLVLEWAVADPIAPWFGKPAAGPKPVLVEQRLWVANFSLEDALEQYFVNHLRLGFVYRRVIRAEAVWKLIEISPGLAEIFFLGELWWLTTLAKREAGLDFDRIVVDAPATGHGASLFDVPASLESMGAAGMLALEVRRVSELLADPKRAGAFVVALPEPLVMAETVELVPRLTARMGRAPLGLVVNRSAAGLVSPRLEPGALPVSAASRAQLVSLDAELRARAHVEAELYAALAQATVHGAASLPELLGLLPAGVVRALASAVGSVSP